MTMKTLLATAAISIAFTGAAIAQTTPANGTMDTTTSSGTTGTNDSSMSTTKTMHHHHKMMHHHHKMMHRHHRAMHKMGAGGSNDTMNSGTMSNGNSTGAMGNSATPQ